MLKVKLTPEEIHYYKRLFNEDKNFYTIINSLETLPMFQNKFENVSEILAFTEFLSNIFHIRWDKDVFDNNHRRLLNIIWGIQYAIEFENDQESKKIIEQLIRKFYSKFRNQENKITRRVFVSCKKLIAHHKDLIPDKNQINIFSQEFIKFSLPYIFNFHQEILTGHIIKWELPKQKGYAVNSKNYEVIRYNTQDRIDYIIKNHK